MTQADTTAAAPAPEVKRGLNAGAGGVFSLVRQLPPRIAMELVFTGDPIPAADALKWGLINDVVPDGEVVGAAPALAQRITAIAPLSVWASKTVAYGVDGGVIVTEEPEPQRTTKEFTQRLSADDAKQGPTAFAENRPPVWTAQ